MYPQLEEEQMLASQVQSSPFEANNEDFSAPRQCSSYLAGFYNTVFEDCEKQEQDQGFLGQQWQNDQPVVSNENITKSEMQQDTETQSFGTSESRIQNSEQFPQILDFPILVCGSSDLPHDSLSLPFKSDDLDTIWRYKWCNKRIRLDADDDVQIRSQYHRDGNDQAFATSFIYDPIGAEKGHLMLSKRSRRHSFIAYEEGKGEWVNEQNIIPEQCEDFANSTASLDLQQSKQEGAENQTMIGDHTQKKKQTGQDERVPTQKSIQRSVLHFFKQNDEQTFKILYHNLLIFSEQCKRRAIINLMRFLRICNVAKTIEYSQHEKMASHILDVITAKKFDKLSIEPKVFKKSKQEVDAKRKEKAENLNLQMQDEIKKAFEQKKKPSQITFADCECLGSQCVIQTDPVKRQLFKNLKARVFELGKNARHNVAEIKRLLEEFIVAVDETAAPLDFDCYQIKEPNKQFPQQKIMIEKIASHNQVALSGGDLNFLLVPAPTMNSINNMVDKNLEIASFRKDIEVYSSPFDEDLEWHQMGSVNIFGLITSAFKQSLLDMFFQDFYNCLIFLTVSPALKHFFKDQYQPSEKVLKQRKKDGTTDEAFTHERRQEYTRIIEDYTSDALSTLFKRPELAPVAAGFKKQQNALLVKLNLKKENAIKLNLLEEKIGFRFLKEIRPDQLNEQNLPKIQNSTRRRK